jgi:hypothetical protein
VAGAHPACRRLRGHRALVRGGGLARRSLTVLDLWTLGYAGFATAVILARWPYPVTARLLAVLGAHAALAALVLALHPPPRPRTKMVG